MCMLVHNSTDILWKNKSIRSILRFARITASKKLLCVNTLKKTFIVSTANKF